VGIVGIRQKILDWSNFTFRVSRKFFDWCAGLNIDIESGKYS
jgi:hypothetical protein